MKRNKFLIFIVALILCTGVFTGTVFAESETASASLEAPTYVTALNYQEYMSFESNSASATHTHKFVFYSFDAPSTGKNSASEDGLITGTCSYCGKMLSISVPYGMTYQITARKDATEASDGYIRYDYDANNSTLKLTAEQKENALLTFTITIPAKSKCTSAEGHKWDAGTVTTEATCATKGVMTYTCENCGAKKTELIDRTNHYKEGKWVFLNWVVKPTCKDPIGSALYYCEQCDKNVQFVRGGTDAELSAAHVWDEGEVITPLTDEEDGETLYTCTLCGETKTETIHNWTPVEHKDATCTEDGYIQYACTNCTESGKKEILPATGHNWLTLEDGSKYCSICNTDEEGKPLYIAADYVVSRTEQDYTSEEALGDFADVIGEDEEPLYYADIKMHSVEDDEEVSEFSEHGNCPSFDISLAELGVDSSTPIEDIHVYHQHEDGEPYEIPDCDKMIVGDCLRVFVRNFSPFVLAVEEPVALASTGIAEKANFLFTVEPQTTISITGIDWKTSDEVKPNSITISLYESDTSETALKSITLKADDSWKNSFTELTSGQEYYLSVPGFCISGKDKTANERYVVKPGDSYQLEREFIQISYAIDWVDYDNLYSLRPTKEVVLSGTTDGKSWTEIDKQTGNPTPASPFTWTRPTYINSTGDLNNPTYKKVTYSVTEKIPDSKDSQCYTVTYSTDGATYSNTAPQNIKTTTTVYIKNTLNEKDWSLSKTWRNSTRLVVTMPYSVTCNLIYSKDAVNWSYVTDKNNNGEPIEFTLTANGGWSATVQHLPAGYYYRFLEARIQVGNTWYKTTYTNTSKTAGYAYRYLYRSLNSNTQNKTIITNTYNPSAVPYTGDSSNLLQWSVVAAVTVLTLMTGTVVYVRRTHRKSSKGAD